MSGTRDQAMEISVSVLARHPTAWERINKPGFWECQGLYGALSTRVRAAAVCAAKEGGPFTKLGLHNEGVGMPG